MSHSTSVPLPVALRSIAQLLPASNTDLGRGLPQLGWGRPPRMRRESGDGGTGPGGFRCRWRARGAGKERGGVGRPDTLPRAVLPLPSPRRLVSGEALPPAPPEDGQGQMELAPLASAAPGPSTAPADPVPPVSARRAALSTHIWHSAELGAESGSCTELMQRPLQTPWREKDAEAFKQTGKGLGSTEMRNEAGNQRAQIHISTNRRAGLSSL